MGNELECSLLMSKQKLELIDILREAAAIPSKNIKFVIFFVLTSFPLLCFLVFYDTVLHKTLVNTSSFVSHDPDSVYFYYDSYAETWSQHESMSRTYTTLKDLCPQLVQFCLLYLVPYQFLELFTLVMTVDASSYIYTKDNNKILSLKEMIHKPFDKTRLVGTLVTSIYVTLFSTATLIGLLWIVINYYILSGGYIYSSYFFSFGFNQDDYSVIKIVLIVLHGAAFLGLLRKYLEWSAGWNMSLVVSVVEEAYGAEALDVSDYFIRGSEERGLILMLVFFVWVVVLRLPCLYLGCGSETGGVLVSYVIISLACLGNVMKWVACMVYFYDCKRRVLEKKIDVEVGTEAKAVGP